MNIRQYQERDRDAIKTITAICFEGVGIDYNIEQRYGVINDMDWRSRKVRHIDDDVAANAEGTFVAEEAGTVIGYVTTRIDHDSKIGSIPNLGVLPAYRGAGIGRQLIETAINYAKASGMAYLRIETLEQNPIGQYLYPSCGFEEVARQIHYIRPLS
ncbi:MAG: GNAT family N-acetyltransferase [Caldilineaceae bacterium]|nr:GNAT family N-acetyltransferase [Caldilineaceae bacterium]